MRDLLLRVLGPARTALVWKFLRFGTVGASGFVIDTAVVYGLRGAIGLYGAGAAAYVVAATYTWWANRMWTFRGSHRLAMREQWMLFLATNSVGFVINRGIFAALVTFVPFCADYPVVAIAAGVAAGMFLNFAAALKLVFAGGQPHPPAPPRAGPND